MVIFVYLKMVNNGFASKSDPNKSWDIAIIGSGPAALTAAIYTTRGAASTLILGGESWGGQLMLTTLVENFPGFPEGIQGPELINNMRKQAERFGAEFIEKNVEKVDFSKKPFEIFVQGVKYFAKVIIIATGASNKWLGVPGEKELIGRGVASCAPCDAPLYKGKKVAVVGGGDSAMTEALVLTKYATEVTIIHRRDQFRASSAMQKKVFDQVKLGKIKIVWNTEVGEVQGSGKVEKLILKNSNDNSIGELVIDGVFVAIGHVPDSDIFKGSIQMDEKGYIKISQNPKLPAQNYNTSTNIPGVFVAGEANDYKYKQAITTAGFGCMAGMDALRYLDKNLPSW